MTPVQFVKELSGVGLANGEIAEAMSWSETEVRKAIAWKPEICISYPRGARDKERILVSEVSVDKYRSIRVPYNELARDIAIQWGNGDYKTNPGEVRYFKGS